MIASLVTVLVLALSVLPLWGLFRMAALSRENQRLANRLLELEQELAGLDRRTRQLEHSQAQPVGAPAPQPPPALPAMAEAGAAPGAAPPPLPGSVTPPPLVPPPFAPAALSPSTSTAPAASNWEQFMGAKLFAWLGGFAAFLGAVFFVKYSFEHNLIPPGVRVTLGFIFGAVLIGGGLFVPRERYLVTAHTLIGTGIVSLYAVSAAAYALYHFPLFGPVATLVVMSLITLTAILLAIRLEARVIAVLGVVGGFVSPLLLSTGRDHPTALFAYLAILDVGLAAISLRRGWGFLLALGAGGSALLEILWAGGFFGDPTLGVSFGGGLAIVAVFLAAFALAREDESLRAAAWSSAATSVYAWFVVGFSFAVDAHGAIDVETLFLLAIAGSIVLCGLTAIDARKPTSWLPLTALLGTSVIEYAWHGLNRPHSAPEPIAWYAGIALGFTVWPFLLRSRLARWTGPWATSALAGLAAFPLVYHDLKPHWPTGLLGLIPALFAIPPAIALFWVRQTEQEEAGAALDQEAWYAGMTLLWVTLIIPIQFKHQWWTLGWAFEGAALIYLYRHIPHRLMHAAGVALLVAAFARLALNPAVLSYHPRSATAVWNWYLYTYGLVTAALFVGARWVASDEDVTFGVHLRGALNALATVLLFLLLNIEIADYFSVPGARVLTFDFSGNFSRDLAYTIAWAVFAFALLLVGIARQLRVARRAALGLLGITVLKLFLHDLARLHSLHRIGALFAVAIIAILASIAYQRFLPADRNTDPR